MHFVKQWELNDGDSDIARYYRLKEIRDSAVTPKVIEHCQEIMDHIKSSWPNRQKQFE